MKKLLRQICWPVLRFFESGTGDYHYSKSHRTILLFVGSLFLFLSLVSLASALNTSKWGALVPFIVFFLAGMVCIIVGACGSDRAVAKIWGSK
jgi:hypothetical protein